VMDVPSDMQYATVDETSSDDATICLCGNR
jgi:hypothetical protein